MAENFRAMVIADPRSAGGRTGKDWPRIWNAVKVALPDCAYIHATDPGEATVLAREAIRDGCELIVALGGDGTVGDVVGGFFDGDAVVNSDAVLGVLPCGESSDLVGTLGVPEDFAGAVSRLAGRASRPIDVGRATYTTPDGRTGVRHFVGVAGFGIGGDVGRRVDRMRGALGAKASIALASLASILFYRNQRVRLTVDERMTQHRVLFGAVIANGPLVGGGMRVAPEADLHDGLFDVVLLGDFGRIEALTRMRRVDRDARGRNPKVETLRARRIAAESDQEMLVGVEGKQPGRLPATFDSLPGAIRIKA
jgi:YegS/Rv2252/BmrU family lipid kinase